MSIYFLLENAPEFQPPGEDALDLARSEATKAFVDAEICGRRGYKRSSAEKLANETGTKKSTYICQYRGVTSKKGRSLFQDRHARLCESHPNPKKRIPGTVDTWEHGPAASLLWDTVRLASFSQAETMYEGLLFRAAAHSPSRAGLAAYAALGPKRREWNDPGALAFDDPVILSPWIVELLANDNLCLAVSLLISKAKMDYYRAPINPRDPRRRYSAGLIYDLLATERSAYKIEQYGLTRDAITDLLGWPSVDAVSHQRFCMREVGDALENMVAAQGQQSKWRPMTSGGVYFWSRAETIKQCPGGPEINMRLKELGMRYRLDEQWQLQLSDLAANGVALLRCQQRHTPGHIARPEQIITST